MNWKVLAVGAALIASPVFAQVQVGVGVQVSVPVPTIHFDVAPPLVVVQPGVQVVQDYGDEVFFVDGWYWCRRDNYWFRTRDAEHPPSSPGYLDYFGLTEPNGDPKPAFAAYQLHAAY